LRDNFFEIGKAPPVLPSSMEKAISEVGKHPLIASEGQLKIKRSAVKICPFLCVEENEIA
jgi:hypothetical protein